MTCWTLLDIAPTDDATAIRRAYAARLKAIDLDRDADAYQALRAARDEAMWRAHTGFLEDDEAGADQDDEDWGLGDPAEFVDVPPQIGIEAAPPGAAPAASSDAPESDDDPWQTLYTLLDPDDTEAERDFPDGDTANAMRSAFDAIVADPRMEAIDFYADQERWLATVLAMAWPTSEPLVAPAVRTFAWEREAGQIGRDWSIDFLVQRVRAVAFEAQVSRPGHSYHPEWRELTKPATERSWRNPLLRRRWMSALIERIRAEYPTLERRLDPWRVAMWEQPPASRSWVVTLVVIVLLNALIRLPSCDHKPAAPSAPAVQTFQNAVAASSFGRTTSATAIWDANPQFWSRLAKLFDETKTRGGASDQCADAPSAPMPVSCRTACAA